jgi:hypothetical protein
MIINDRGFTYIHFWNAGGSADMEKKIGDIKSITDVMIPTVCPMSRRYTPIADINQVTPRVPMIRGKRITGNHKAVKAIPPWAIKHAANKTVRLTNELKTADIKDTTGKISRGKTTRLTYDTFDIIRPGAEFTHSAKRACTINPTNRIIAKSILLSLRPVSHFARNTTEKINV